jgi:Protein of unknown function (DUF2997)
VHIIEITVSPKGETTLETKGFAGADCLQASKWLQNALGMAASDNKTAEFYQAVILEQTFQQNEE